MIRFQITYERLAIYIGLVGIMLLFTARFFYAWGEQNCYEESVKQTEQLIREIREKHGLEPPKTNGGMKLTENDLIDLGFEKRLVLGTGFVSISSMIPAKYYYVKGRLAINCVMDWWTWFLDDEPRNDIAKHSKKELEEYIKTIQTT